MKPPKLRPSELKVLEVLQTGRIINNRDIGSEIKTAYLPTIISNLRKSNYKIYSRRIQIGKNRYITEYSMNDFGYKSKYNRWNKKRIYKLKENTIYYQVLAYLYLHEEGITIIKFRELFNRLNLGSVISILRNDYGINIKDRRLNNGSSRAIKIYYIPKNEN